MTHSSRCAASLNSPFGSGTTAFVRYGSRSDDSEQVKGLSNQSPLFFMNEKTAAILDLWVKYRSNDL